MLMKWKPDRRTVAWALYDWANSAFATIVIAGFFPILYRNQWADSLPGTEITFTLGLANSASSVLLVLFAPLLGALADAGAAGKRFLLLFTVIGGMTTLLLGWVPAGEWRLAAAVYVVAVAAFMFANVFYDALLAECSRRDDYERVSSLGYALGYAGGGLLFAVFVVLLVSVDHFDDLDSVAVMRSAFYATGVWWLAFSLPMWWWKQERKPVARWVYAGLQRFLGTLRLLRSHRQAVWFLLAYWLYIDGVGTIIRMAADYGQALGFGPGQVVVALLVVQLVGFPATLFFGVLATRVGARCSLLLGIAVYVLICVWAAALETLLAFYAVAVLIGCVQGGVQAQSRALFLRLVPASQVTQFFGIYNLLGRFAVLIGPPLLGWVGMVTETPRLGILSIATLFIAGGMLLFKVRQP